MNGAGNANTLVLNHCSAVRAPPSFGSPDTSGRCAGPDPTFARPVPRLTVKGAPDCKSRCQRRASVLRVRDRRAPMGHFRRIGVDDRSSRRRALRPCSARLAEDSPRTPRRRDPTCRRRTSTACSSRRTRATSCPLRRRFEGQRVIGGISVFMRAWRAAAKKLTHLLYGNPSASTSAIRQ